MTYETLTVELQPDGYYAAYEADKVDYNLDAGGYRRCHAQGEGKTPLDAIIDLLDAEDHRAMMTEAHKQARVDHNRFGGDYQKCLDNALQGFYAVANGYRGIEIKG